MIRAHVLAPLALLFLARCASPAAPADAADTATAADVPSDSTQEASSDVPVTDTAAPDAPNAADASDATDATRDAAVDAGTDASSCTPASGSMTLTAYCDQMQLAVMQHGAAPATLHLEGRLTSSSGLASCTLVDSIDVVIGGATAQTLDLGGRYVPTDGSVGFWTVDRASQPLVQMCASDMQRFDGIGLVVHGRTDGGTFTAMCGNNTFDTGWPPRVVVSCHQGLDAPPTNGDGIVMTFGTMASDQIYATIPQPPTIQTFDGSIHVDPGTPSAFGAMPIAPFDSNGWMGSSATQPLADGSNANSLSLFNMSDPLGMQLCPTPTTMPDPTMPPPPVFLARISGTTDAGPFTSEIYVSMCTRMP